MTNCAKPKFPQQIHYVGPLYSQVHAQLREMLRNGHWTTKSSLPCEGRLATEFGVSVGTMRKALDLLVAEGLVKREQGRGTIVCDFMETLNSRLSSYQFISPSNTLLEYHLLTNLVRCATPDDQEHLDIQLSESIRVAERLVSIGHEVRIAEISKVPEILSIAPASEANVYFPLQPLGPIARSTETICAIAADAALSEFLGCAANAPLLSIERISHAPSGAKIAWHSHTVSLTGVKYLSRT